jgi:hypothetical protein
MEAVKSILQVLSYGPDLPMAVRIIDSALE